MKLKQTIIKSRSIEVGCQTSESQKKIRLISAKDYLHCPDCGLRNKPTAKISSRIAANNMSVPMGAFAACKVRENIKNNANFNTGHQDQLPGMSANGKSTTEDSFGSAPAKYNEKLMMSIWGLYNRYSVHNMKSHKSLDKA